MTPLCESNSAGRRRKTKWSSESNIVQANDDVMLFCFFHFVPQILQTRNNLSQAVDVLIVLKLVELSLSINALRAL